MATIFLFRSIAKGATRAYDMNVSTIGRKTMGRSLKDLAAANVVSDEQSIAEQNFPAAAREEAESIFASYSGMREQELMNELLSITAKQKADGSYDMAAIQKGIESIAPLLNEEQRRKLKGIIDTVM